MLQLSRATMGMPLVYLVSHTPCRRDRLLDYSQTLENLLGSRITLLFIYRERVKQYVAVMPKPLQWQALLLPDNGADSCIHWGYNHRVLTGNLHPCDVTQRAATFNLPSISRSMMRALCLARYGAAGARTQHSSTEHAFDETLHREETKVCSSPGPPLPSPSHSIS